MIVIDCSSLVGAAIGSDSVPRRAVDYASLHDRIALSTSVRDEVSDVLHRPELARFIDPIRRKQVLALLLDGAAWFEPTVRVTDCRDPSDDKYLELALASAAHTIISSDNDLLVLHPWRGVRILSPAQYLAAPLA